MLCNVAHCVWGCVEIGHLICILWCSYNSLCYKCYWSWAGSKNIPL